MIQLYIYFFKLFHILGYYNIEYCSCKLIFKISYLKLFSGSVQKYNGFFYIGLKSYTFIKFSC